MKQPEVHKVTDVKLQAAPLADKPPEVSAVNSEAIEPVVVHKAQEARLRTAARVVFDTMASGGYNLI